MKEIQREEETFGKVKWWRNSLFSLRNKWKMESLIVAANIIKAALSNFFHINIELDGSLNQQPISDIFSAHSLALQDQKMVLHLQYWKGYNRTGAEWHNGIHLVRWTWHILMSYMKMGLNPGQPTTDVHTSEKEAQASSDHPAKPNATTSCAISSGREPVKLTQLEPKRASQRDAQSAHPLHC